MKILVLTAIFGGVDTQKPFAPQSLPDGVVLDRVVITEANTPVPLPNLPDRLKGKYFKMQAHRIYPGYSAYVWIDGNIEVTSPDFVWKMVDGLNGIRIQKHHERETVGQEIDFILKSENPYLKVRYDSQPLKEEYEWYLSKGMPPDAPLYSCNVFACRNMAGSGANRLFDEWLNLCLEWSWFDQSAFSYLAWKYNKRLGLNGRHDPKVETVDLGGVLTSPYFKLHSHDNWNK